MKNCVQHLIISTKAINNSDSANLTTIYSIPRNKSENSLNITTEQGMICCDYDTFYNSCNILTHIFIKQFQKNWKGAENSVVNCIQLDNRLLLTFLLTTFFINLYHSLID